MANVQLFVKPQTSTSIIDAPGISTKYTQLDLMQTEPIKLSLSIQDFEDPTKVASSFSQTFKVPHTAKNGQFFKAVFNVNSTDFDISKKADAYLLNDGTFFISGNIRLNSVTINSADKDIQYEITFFGQTNDFAGKIGGGFLNELDFTSANVARPEFNLNHMPSYINITNSWQGLLEDGNIVYGLIEWGYKYDQENRPINTTLSRGFLKSFDDSANPLWLEQFKPQVRAKIVWDKIFYDAGYTYESDFLDSDKFKKLYIISESEARPTLETQAQFSATGTMPYNGFWPALITGQYYKARCNSEQFDYLNAYDASSNPPTYEYTAQSTSYHVFVVRSSFAITNGSNNPPTTNNRFIIQLRNSRPGGPTYTHTITQNSAVYSGSNFSIPLNLQEGDKITMWVSIQVPFGYGTHNASFSNLLFSCTASGSNFNISSIFPPTIKKIDFIRSIVKKFKLVLIPHKDKLNHFIIKPWFEWIREGTQLDWTNKVDMSKSISIRPLFDKQKRKVVFTEKDDTDYLNDEYQKSHDKKPFGQLILDSNIDLITGEETIDTDFAPCPIAPIAYESTTDPGSPSFLIPHIAKDSGGSQNNGVADVNVGKREPIAPKMRLLYYNGVKSSYWPWYMARAVAGGNQIQQTSYPFFSNFSTWPVTTSSLDLNWKNQVPLWDVTFSGLTAWETPLTTFTVYWKDWYDIMYDPYSRLVEANFILDYKDLIEFNFNDIIFVKDAWYIVNEIKDYVVGETSSCKVVLVKLGSALNLNLEAPEPFNSVELCTSTVNYCTAYCCCQKPSTCSTLSTYYYNGETLLGSQFLYSDPFGSIPAPPMYYSDGTVAFTVGANGIILAYNNTGLCSCGAIIDTNFQIQYSKFPCATLGPVAPISVFGSESTFLDNTHLYLDSALTVPAPYGYYRESSDSTTALKVNDLGKVIAEVALSECPSETFYPFYPKFAAVECDACCSIDSRVIYTDNIVFTSSTEAYLDNVGTTPAEVGYYAVGDDIMYVTPAGTVDSFTSCTSCAACPDGTVSVNVCVFQDLDGYKTTGSIYTSIDGISWTNRGYVEVTTVHLSGTPTCQEFLLDEDLYVRVIFGSDLPSAILTVSYEVDSDPIFIDDTTTPGTYTYTFPTKIQSGVSYYITGSADGGSVVVPTYTAMDLWFEKAIELPCSPYCHLYMLSDTYYGDNLTLGTSTYLYKDSGGTVVAKAGWYSDGVVIYEVGANGLITSSYDSNNCKCDQEETVLYPYQAYYDASSGCDACCSGVLVTVYGTEPVWSDCKVFYQYGPSGLEPASAGYYSVNNYYIQIDVNGSYVGKGSCLADCTCTAYFATYYIINRTSSTVFYTYTGEDTLLYTGSIEPGKFILTVCMDISTLTTTGYCEIKEDTSCMP